ncbi:cholinesterase-like [Anticarsia gemmatalis]|uniref:cholinesterase-like n=1 Tax=Anticarsia gemmatalis TaxID=129554 RepID=UPI003F765BC8
MLLKRCVILFLLPLVYGKTRIDPLVDTEVGLIRGLRADDGDYSMFLGIPFAKVDENNPFGASVPYPNFEDTYDAFDDSAICPQIEEFNNTSAGTLDCLNLNIFVPLSATSTNRVPVLVWVYGGAFRIGFGNRHLYGPKFLVRHDIILVTVNYRLGPYGFMCLDTPEIPGNQGLKDQLLALRWIKKNIAAFGGDANRITIFGESAGSIALDMHLVSNNEKLYDKAILQSGTALSPVIYEPIRRAPMMLAKYLGFSTDDMDKALKFLTKVDTRLVIAAGHDLGISNDFRPCIEKEFEGVESVLTENWITAKIPKVRRMPILIGFNSDERYAYHTSEDDKYYKNLNVIQKHLANGFDVNSYDFEGMEDLVRQFYFGDEEIGAAVRQNVVDLESDFMYIHPTYRSIYKYLDNGARNIFLYVFSYYGDRNFVRRNNNVTSGTGATHADEIGYLFDVSYMKGEEITSEDQKVIDQMTTMWTNFVKYGNPTPETSDLLPVKWTPITSKSEMPYLDIGSTLSLSTRPFNERAVFWDLFYKANAHLQIAYPSAKVEL